MGPTYFVYLGIAVVALYLLASLRTASRAGLRKLPGPLVARFSNLYHASLLVGGKAPSEYRKVHEKYGPIVRIGPNHVSVSDPSMIPVIYGIGSNFVKAPFYTIMGLFYQGKPMESMFSTRDPIYHRNLKRPVAGLFSMTNMRNYEPYADECCGIFIDSMREMQDQVVDLGAWVQWYAFDVIAYITFQRRFGFMEQRKDINNMIADLDTVFWYQKFMVSYPKLHFWLLGSVTVARSVKKLFPNFSDPTHSFLMIADEEIKRYDAQDKQDKRTDFLAQLRAKEAKDGQLTHRDIMNHLTNNLLAGSDTTGISLRACFYYLMKTPRAYQKLLAEIDEAEKNGQLSTYVTYEECLKLPYLQAVMKEALRIHPGVGFPLERTVPPEGATICDMELPGGTVVSMTAPVLHMDKTVFGEDVDEFRPERWIEASPEQLKLMDRSYFVFGHGSRTCIGKNISIMEMGKFIPQIFRQFDVEWASPEPEWRVETAWFSKQLGILVRFKPREKS